MTLETLIADAVERGVLAAMTRLNAAAPTAGSSSATPPADPAVTPKKPGRPKKADATGSENAVVTETPLPPPAPAPASAIDDIEADRARLIALTARIENGRKLATELIKRHGPKFDGLDVGVRQAILAELEAKVDA